MVGVVVTQHASRGRPLGWLLVLLCLLCPPGVIRAATAPAIQGAWQLVDAHDTPATVLANYRDSHMQAFNPDLLQRLPTEQSGSWVVLKAAAPADDELRVLSITPAPIGGVEVYLPDGSSERLASDDFDQPMHGHGRLALRLQAVAGQDTVLLIKLGRHSELLSPTRFRLQSLDAFLETDTLWLVMATACFAVMLTMALMATCFALMLRDTTFAWYAGYMLCYVLVQATHSGYVFHPLGWRWLAGTQWVVGIGLTGLSVSFACLFVYHFCDIRQNAPLLRVPVKALGVVMPLLVVARVSQLPLVMDMAQTLFAPVMILGGTLLFVSGVIAMLRGSRAARFFLLGWTPLLVLTSLTSAQVIGVLSSLDWLTDGSIATGAFEAIVLSLGLADRALTMRRDRDSVRVLAERDPLTDLFNRRAWTEGGLRMLDSAVQKGQPLALLFMDLDHFKQLNDHHGHAAGDRALVQVAQVLRQELRPSDLLGRYGGEEFVAMLHGISREQALQIATRLCRRVHRLEFPVNQEGLVLSTSIGVAMRAPGDSLDTLLERADQAMYQVKLKGRNNVFAFERRAELTAPRRERRKA